MPDEHTGGIRNIIYYFVFLYYFILVGYFVIFCIYFLIVCFYFKIKQNFMRREIQILVRTSRRTENLRRERFLLKSFVKNMKNSINLVTEIAIYNSFWSSYMTFYYFFYIMIMSFVFSIFITSFNFQTGYMLITAISHLILLSKISSDCSNIGNRNMELYFSLKNIYYRLQKHGIKENIGFALKVKSFLSLDCFFQHSSFKLKNGYRINNRLLEFFLTSMIGVSLRTYGDTIRRQFFR